MSGLSAARIIAVRSEEYQILGAVGRGASATVYRARRSRDGKTFALKHIYEPRRDFFLMFVKEISQLRKLRGHNNVIQLEDYEVRQDQQQLVIVMEFAEGDLASYLQVRSVL